MSESTPTEQLSALCASYETARQTYHDAVLSLCSELPVREAFEARLSLVEGIPEFRPERDIDFEVEGRIMYEGMDSGYFDVEIPGADDPRYTWEFRGEYQDHDVFVGWITVELCQTGEA
jgi:hypothetical protein